MTPSANDCSAYRDTRRFVVIGAQRTGTNILREILNTNEQIAMLGEVFWPDPAPAHWDNFLRLNPSPDFPPSNQVDAESLLDRYFDFVEQRIRHHWAGNAKSNCRAIGVDIKYDQLRRVAPESWNPASPPFLLSYLKSRDFLLIHTIRRNVILGAISEIVAEQRNLWHNYHGSVIDRSYYVPIDDCLGRARRNVERCNQFRAFTSEYRVVETHYEELADNIARAAGGRIGSGPLWAIADALGVPHSFTYDGGLKRAIDIPYSRLISNHADLRDAVRKSEFSSLADTLQ